MTIATEETCLAIKAKTDALPGSVWDEPVAGHATAGSTGKTLSDINAKTANLPAAPAAQAKLDTLHDTRIPGVIQPQTGDAFARLGAPVGASLSADVAAAKTIVDAVKAKTDALPASPAAQAKLDTLHDTRIPGVVQPQTGDAFARLGAPAGATVSADIAAVKAETAAILGYVDAEVAAIKAKTDNLPSDPADESLLEAAIATRLAAASYTAPDNTGIADAKTAAQAVRDAVGSWTGPTSGTFSLLSGTTEQDAVTVTGITKPTHVMAVLDLNLVTQPTDALPLDVKVYEKVDGTNYRETDRLSWVPTDPKAVRLEFWAQHDYKIALKPNVTEGANRDVPYRHSRRVTA